MLLILKILFCLNTRKGFLTCLALVVQILPFHSNLSATDFLIYPLDKNNLGIAESISDTLTNHDSWEAVPLDVSLKGLSILGNHSAASGSFASFLGVDYLIQLKTENDTIKLVIYRVHPTLEPIDNHLIKQSHNPITTIEHAIHVIKQSLNISWNQISIKYTTNLLAHQIYSLAIEYQVDNHYPRVEALLETVLQLDPQFTAARIRLADTYLTLGKMDKARYLLENHSFENEPVSYRLNYYSNLGQIHEYSGQIDQSVESRNRAINLARQLNLQRALVPILFELANLSKLYLNDPKKAFTIAQEAEQINRSINNDKGLVESKLNLSRIALYLEPDGEKARAYLEQAQRIARFSYPQHKASMDYIRALNGKRYLDSDTILELFDSAAKQFKEIGSVFSYLDVKTNQALFLNDQGFRNRAQRILTQSIPELKKHGFFMAEINARHQLATSYIQSNRNLDAALLLFKNLELLQERPILSLQKTTYTKIIPTWLKLNHYHRALKTSQDLLEMTRKTEPRSKRYSYLLNNHGEILYLLGQYVDADVYFQRSLEIKRSTNDPMSIAWTLRNRVAVKIQQNDAHTAKALLDECENIEPDKLANVVLRAQLHLIKGQLRAGKNLLVRARKDHPQQWKPIHQNLLEHFNSIKSTQNRATDPILPNNF